MSSDHVTAVCLCSSAVLRAWRGGATEGGRRQGEDEG